MQLCGAPSPSSLKREDLCSGARAARPRTLAQWNGIHNSAPAREHPALLCSALLSDIRAAGEAELWSCTPMRMFSAPQMRNQPWGRTNAALAAGRAWLWRADRAGRGALSFGRRKHCHAPAHAAVYACVLLILRSGTAASALARGRETGRRGGGGKYFGGEVKLCLG